MSGIDPQEDVLLRAIMEALNKVIDPETGTDVLKLGLVRNIQTDGGFVRFTLRPASSVCPAAFALGALIKETVSAIPGVETLSVKVTNYTRAAELESILNEGVSQKGEG